MDPLSIAGTCVSLVGTITKTSILVTGFVRDVRAARSDLDAVSRELLSLKTVLELLADDFAEPAGKSFPETLRKQITGIVSNCSGVVIEIEHTLKKHEGTGLKKSAQWVLSGKDDIAKLRSSLEAHKSALEIALDMVNLTMSIEIKADTQEILIGNSAILEGNSAIKEDTAAILAQIARLQEHLPRDRLHNSGFMLHRYLDNLTSYAETVVDTFSDDYAVLSERAESTRSYTRQRRGSTPVSSHSEKSEPEAEPTSDKLVTELSITDDPLHRRPLLESQVEPELAPKPPADTPSREHAPQQRAIPQAQPQNLPIHIRKSVEVNSESLPTRDAVPRKDFAGRYWPQSLTSHNPPDWTSYSEQVLREPASVQVRTPKPPVSQQPDPVHGHRERLPSVRQPGRVQNPSPQQPAYNPISPERPLELRSQQENQPIIPPAPSPTLPIPEGAEPMDRARERPAPVRRRSPARQPVRQQSTSSGPLTVSFYSKSWQANDVGKNSRGSWERSYVEPEEVEELLRGCTVQLKTRALDIPFFLLPFGLVSEERAGRTFVENFFSRRLTGEALAQELRLTDPHVICIVTKWCWSRLQGGVVGWETYELFSVGESASNMARDSFTTFMPLSVASGARTNIIFDFFDLLSATAAHANTNGLFGHEVSRLAGWWAFKHDLADGFERGYKNWLSAAHATSHLFFAYLRALMPVSRINPSGISAIPWSLQKLLIETEYPPERSPPLTRSVRHVVMIVDTTAATPFALLRRASSFQYRENDIGLRELSEYKDPVRALTEECRRVLKLIALANSTSAYFLPAQQQRRHGFTDQSWAAFEDIGFSRNSSDTTSSQTIESDLPPGPGPSELAIITSLDLDEAFRWVWISSLAPEETPDRKAAFGRSVLFETVIPAHQWIVFEEVATGVAPVRRTSDDKRPPTKLQAIKKTLVGEENKGFEGRWRKGKGGSEP